MAEAAPARAAFRRAAVTTRLSLVLPRGVPNGRSERGTRFRGGFRAQYFLKKTTLSCSSAGPEGSGLDRPCVPGSVDAQPGSARRWPPLWSGLTMFLSYRGG